MISNLYRSTSIWLYIFIYQYCIRLLSWLEWWLFIISSPADLLKWGVSRIWADGADVDSIARSNSFMRYAVEMSFFQFRLLFSFPVHVFCTCPELCCFVPVRLSVLFVDVFHYIYTESDIIPTPFFRAKCDWRWRWRLETFALWWTMIRWITTEYESVDRCMITNRIAEQRCVHQTQ